MDAVSEDQSVSRRGGIRHATINRSCHRRIERHREADCHHNWPTNGYQVIGTARRPERVEPIANVTLLPLDVSDDTSVHEFAARVLADARQVDLLVNNAGVTLEGAVEETTLGEARAMFETNFFGVLRVTKEFLPHMRERRTGRVIVIGSVAGFLPKPFEAVYSASKHAIKAWTESLDHEVRQFGVRGILIEPGFIRTSIEQNSGSAQNHLDHYRAFRQRAVSIMRADIERGDSPEAVAKVVVEAAHARTPALHYLAGKGANWLRFQRSWLPASLFDRGLRSRFGLP